MVGALMKVLIWFCCILVYSIVVTSLRYAGVILGGIPTALLSFLLVFFPAPALCRAWSRRKKRHSDSPKVPPSDSPASENKSENTTSSDTAPTPSTQKSGETFYLMETDDGFLVRVPESKLGAWDKAQKQPSRPLNKAERLLIDRIVSSVYDQKHEEPAASPTSPLPPSDSPAPPKTARSKKHIRSSTVVLSIFVAGFAALSVFFAVRSFLLQSSLETATADLEHYMELSEQYYSSRYDDGYKRGYEVGYATHRTEVSDELSFWTRNAVLVTEHGDRYHSWDCGFVQDRPFWIYKVSDAVARGYTPCSFCKPPRLFYFE